MKGHSRRSKLEMHVDTLKALACHGPLKLTYITYKANVNCSVMKQFLDSLAQQGLVEEQTFRKKRRWKTVYAITEKGRTALDCFKEITRALQTTEESQRPYVFI
jgi:predicted transcriptional regulator